MVLVSRQWICRYGCIMMLTCIHAVIASVRYMPARLRGVSTFLLDEGCMRMYSTRVHEHAYTCLFAVPTLLAATAGCESVGVTSPGFAGHFTNAAGLMFGVQGAVSWIHAAKART